MSTKTCPRGNCFRKISKSASFPWYLKSNAKINKIPQFFGGGIYKFLPWCYSSGIERQSKNCFRQYTQLNACRKKEIIIKTRIEADSIGSLEVPSDAYYGVQSLRAKRNFPITGTPIHPVMIQNLAKIKKAAAISNREAQRLPEEKAAAIIYACDEIIAGKLKDQFIVDGIQGGAGTSANMNANEVIANRAIEILGGTKGDYTIVHPNDHVNMAQSTNDVIPSAGKLTVLDLLPDLLHALESLHAALLDKSQEFDHILKMGRTQLEDAVPMRLGQSFHAYATMIERDIRRIERARKELFTLNLGGTAIGTTINASDYYLHHIVPTLAAVTGYPLMQADDLFDATENLDGFVTISNTLKTCAVNLSKMCNDLRLLSSGPRTGFGEINLPPMQNGSSIMPGKINPVIPEVVTQVAFHVIGNDTTITMAAEAGQMELNAFEPVVFYSLFSSITSMTGAVNTLVKNCILGITANEKRCEDLVSKSVGITTALCPYIGYQKAASIAKKSLKTGESVTSLVLKDELLTQKQLDDILDPYALTGPELPAEDDLAG